MLFLQPGRQLQDRLFPVLGISEKSEPPKTQKSTCCGAKHQEKTISELLAKQRIERQQRKETPSMARPEPKMGDNLTVRNN